MVVFKEQQYCHFKGNEVTGSEIMSIAYKNYE